MRHRFAWLFALLGVAGCSAPDSAVTPSQATPQSAGARLFDGNCAACHQSDGRGLPGVYPSLAGSAVVLGDPRVLALWVVRGQRPRMLTAGRYATSMPKFGWMNAAQTALLLTYLRQQFGNEAPVVEARAMADALSQ